VFVPVAVALALLAPCADLLALCFRRKRLSHGTLGCYIADKVLAFDSADNSQRVLSSPRCLDVSMSRCLLDRRCVEFHCTCAQQPSGCFRCCVVLPWHLRTAAQVLRLVFCLFSLRWRPASWRLTNNEAWAQVKASRRARAFAPPRAGAPPARPWWPRAGAILCGVRRTPGAWCDGQVKASMLARAFAPPRAGSLPCAASLAAGRGHPVRHPSHA
jgi:hypothetical protein